ncbi:MAG: hypothetical protein U0841_13815 [Chloroflexia bacterium]
MTVWPEVVGFGAGAIAMKYRFQWTFPVEFSPHDQDAIYACSNHIHRSTDEGTTWETISPDLTRNDPDKIQSSGGRSPTTTARRDLLHDLRLPQSPHEAGVFWTGSDCGVVNISRDGGKNWTNITPADLPEWSRITILEPSPFDKATCYLTPRALPVGRQPALPLQDDRLQRDLEGDQWQPPGPDEFTRVIRCDPVREGLLYVGTETGVYVSLDDGLTWEWLESNLPVVPIWDLVVKGTDLVAATHGRSFWILDDVTPLRQLAEARNGSATRLFQPRDTTRFRLYGSAPSGRRARRWRTTR